MKVAVFDGVDDDDDDDDDEDDDDDDDDDADDAQVAVFDGDDPRIRRLTIQPCLFQ